MIELLLLIVGILMVAMVPVYLAAILIRSPTPGMFIGIIAVAVALTLIELSLRQVEGQWGWVVGGAFAAVSFSLLFATKTWRGMLLAAVLCATYAYGTEHLLHGKSLGAKLTAQASIAQQQLWPK
ncbi:hypothetical protein [Ferrimonas sp. SCSIO 43195]|uniref:hypothetical protein n=1 Tax=Ferrimonas sp. SCSIO 43195 TaxID=2822844 RepID=UPI002075A979|nr:hypothetical protein [Ferrimonas sp. SCSIO 43195]USD38776.1 hypothetical protein J8Z22_06655 [Ferrimonas sp. SCSIO 43195]